MMPVQKSGNLTGKAASNTMVVCYNSQRRESTGEEKLWSSATEKKIILITAIMND